MFLYFFYKLTGFLSSHLSSSFAYLIARGLADFCFYFPFGKYKQYKKAVFHNISLIVGEDEKNSKVRQVALFVYRNFGKYLREFLWTPKLDRKRFFRLVTPLGLENLDYALSKGKGAILLSAHFGNWEWGGMVVGLAGYKVNSLVQEHNNSWTNELFERTRKEKGIQVIFLRQLKEAVRALKRNEILAILADEDPKEGIKVDFFRHKVSIPIGPFRLARRTEAMITPAFVIRDKRTDRQKGIVEKPLKAEKTQDEEEDLRETANEFIQVMQDYLRYYPDHWFLLKPKKELENEEAW